MTDAVRASGKTPAEEVAHEEVKDLDQQINPELPDERERKFQTPGFSRMRMNFNEDQQSFLAMMHRTINRRLTENFGDAYDLMFELYTLIREPVMHDGKVVRDSTGLPQWKRSSSGQYIEDWSKLGMRERERFLYQLTTRLFIWEQRATEAWAESMYAKVTWELSFSAGYDQPGEGVKDTIEGRTARGKLVAKDDHFLAIFMTYYSRKAEALVRSLERLSIRLKDVHLANGGR